MKLAIMQPYIFPHLSYFQLINAVDRFIIYDDVNFIKKGWINRNRILNDGKDYKFTIPLLKASQNKKINELELSSNSNWKEKLFATLEYNYKNAPFYDTTIELVENIVNYSNKNLAAYNTNSIREVCRYLKIDTEIIDSSSVYNNHNLKAQNRILDICEREEASQYINPINGKKLYDYKLFNDNQIELFFLQSVDVEYDQFGSEYIPRLSIIDVCMFNSIEKVKIMLDSFVLEKGDLT